MSGCLAVGIDLGTTNTKVALVAIDRDRVQIRAVTSAPTPQPRELRPVLLELLRRVLSDAPPPDAIGIASMAETGVPLDRDGDPLGPWLRWDGHRAGQEAAVLSERLGWAELVRATGVRPAAKVPLAVWAWMRTHEPDLWHAMVSWSGAADLACLMLTGELVTDHTLAGRTMAYRLPPVGAPMPETFDAALLAEVGLRPEQLPAVVPHGHVKDPEFVACGLRAGTPVTVAGHDHAVGAYAAGVRLPGDVADSVGTAEAVITVVADVPDPIGVAESGMSTVVPVGGDHRAILAGSSSAGAMVAWWLEHEAAGLAPQQLFEQVRAAQSSGVIVLPYLSGRQAPAPDPEARVRVIGPRRGPVELTRAMFEGLCLQARWMIQEQAGSGGPVTVFGGAGAANQAWTSIKARVFPWPMRLVTAAQPVAAGAALVAAARAGVAGTPSLDHGSVPTQGHDFDEAFERFVKAATVPDERS